MDSQKEFDSTHNDMILKLEDIERREEKRYKGCKGVHGVVEAMSAYSGRLESAQLCNLFLQRRLTEKREE